MISLASTTHRPKGADCEDLTVMTLQNERTRHVAGPAEATVDFSVTRFLFVSIAHLAVSAIIFMIMSAFAAANWLRQRRQAGGK